jgi:zinc transport system substrate-binding protein
VATFYPLAYFAREIGGDYVTVTQLVPDNTELHAWQPSTADIVAANEADILLYNGAGLDYWFVSDVLPSIDQTQKTIVETTIGVTLLERSQNEQDNHDNEHDESLYDPHTWISPFIAEKQAETIYNAFIEKDPSHYEYYTQRWTSLQQQFIAMDNAYMNELSTKQQELIFVTHEAYGYLAYRYGFQQQGIIGLSADEQPSTATIAELVDNMINHDIYVIYVDPIYADDYAQALKSTLEAQTGRTVQVLTLYLLAGKINDMDYFDQQSQNLEHLKIGLEAT